MTTPGHSDSDSYGRFMIYGAWILFLLLLTFIFGNFMEQRDNPNQRPESYLGSSGQAEVRLQQNHQGHYVASGSINGQSATFLLDTGATLVSVPEQLADRLGLERNGRISVSTANGNVPVFTTRLDSVRLGDIEIRDVRATINPWMKNDRILLGMSFMRNLELVQKDKQLILRQQ